MSGWKSKLGGWLVAAGGVLVTLALPVKGCSPDAGEGIGMIGGGLALIGGALLGVGIAHKVEKSAL